LSREETVQQTARLFRITSLRSDRSSSGALASTHWKIVNHKREALSF
jgi:hypothetical protein